MELTFLSQISVFSQKSESLLKVQRAKENFSDNLGHNIFELDNISLQTRFGTSKTKLASSATNLVTSLPNDLRLRISEN